MAATSSGRRSWICSAEAGWVPGLGVWFVRRWVRAKAEQFLAEGKAALTTQHFDSALLLAVHAAISANDAATSHVGQVRSTDPDHLRAADLLQSVTGDGERARQLRGLIGLKNDVEYQSARASAEAAADGIARTERFVGWVRELLH